MKYILKQTLWFLVLCLSFQNTGLAQKKTIAITIDDLPFVGEYRNFHLNMMINTLKNKQVPATGFIIANEVRKDNWELLHQFRDAGFGLGNHTFSHLNLNTVKTKEYIEEIDKADTLLSSVLTQPKYFRYPYLAMGSGRKRDAILCHLSNMNYSVAPITIDSKDFYFNQRLLSVPEQGRRHYLEEMKPFYMDFIWQQTLHAEEHNTYHKQPKQAQILLIHANLLNAYTLPDIIQLYKKQGYSFVTLEDALKTFKTSYRCPKSLPSSFERVLEPSASPNHDHDQALEEFVEWD